MAKLTPLPALTSRTRVSEVAPAILAIRLADVRQPEASVARLDVEAIHDMRVAARRLRAALRLFGLPPAVSAAVKRLQDALGGVRDVQVQLSWLTKQLAEAPKRDRPALDALLRRLESRLPAKVVLLRGELGRWTTETAALVERRARLGFPRHRLGGRHFRRKIRRRLREMARRFRLFRRSQDAITAHRLRIAVKQLRYDAELLKGVWVKELPRLIDRLAPLQDVLGALHDADVRFSVLEQLLGGAGAPAIAERLLKHAGEERALLAKRAGAAVDEWHARDRLRQLRRRFSERALS